MNVLRQTACLDLAMAVDRSDPISNYAPRSKARSFRDPTVLSMYMPHTPETAISTEALPHHFGLSGVPPHVESGRLPPPVEYLARTS